VEPETGMVMNLVDVDDVMRTEVLERFDHTNLNHDPLFASAVPTTENFCIAIYELLERRFPAGMLEHVRVEETENNFFQRNRRDAL
jgi:6-pyruvoyltetrahydropterin/6-carboxytetrahydropterin synthase